MPAGIACGFFHARIQKRTGGVLGWQIEELLSEDGIRKLLTVQGENLEGEPGSSEVTCEGGVQLPKVSGGVQ